MFSKKYLVKKKLIEIPSRLKKAAKNIGQKLILVTNQNSLCTGFFFTDKESSILLGTPSSIWYRNTTPGSLCPRMKPNSPFSESNSFLLKENHCVY